MTDPPSSSVHRIRLKGPWEWAVPTASPAQAWTWSRIRLPEEWRCLPSITGPVWFRRRFQAPTGITPTDQIRLVLSTLSSRINVNLNGRTLPASTSPAAASEARISFDLTPALADRNLLEIVFADGISPTESNLGLGNPVVLEIETSPGPPPPKS